MGFFTDTASTGAPGQREFSQGEHDLEGFDSFGDDISWTDAFDPGKFSSGDASSIAERHGLSEFLGFTAADAAKKAAADMKAGIQEGQIRAQQGTQKQLDTVGGSYDQAMQQLMGGFQGARGELEGGLGAQQGFLDQAGGMYQPEADLMSYLGDYSAGSTAEGRAANMNRIAGSDMFSQLLGNAQTNTGRQLADAGVRRSGHAANVNNNLYLDTLMGMEAEERARTGDLVNRGSMANQNLSNIFQQKAGAAGMGGGQLADLYANQGLQTSSMSERGGLSLADIINRGTQSDIDLLGQYVQAQGAGTMGSADALTSGAGRAGKIVGDYIGGFSDKRLKTNIKKIGEHKGLNVYSWTWNDKANKLGLHGDSIGHIAQELQKTKPHLIHDIGDYIGVDYSTDETVNILETQKAG
jgi:hypothetical protein